MSHNELAALIRLGGGLVDGQSQDAYIDRRSDGVFCCALGAAFYADTGNLPPDNEDTELIVLGHFVNRGIDRDTLENIIKDNDQEGGSSFEEIALSLERGNA